MNIALVVNPFASRVTDERVHKVAAELARAGDVTTLLTERPQHATELVSETMADAVVVFSGDGGYNEALNGLEGETPIGFLPGGGTSVLPRALGLPHDAVAAARQVADALANGRTRRITVGRANGRRFAFSAGVGLDAAAVRHVDHMGRSRDGKRPGDMAFALAVVRVLAAERLHLEPALEVKGLGRAACAFVANAQPYTYAKRVPLPIAPEARFELGLDLVAPVRIRRRSLVRTAYSILAGRPRDGMLYAHDADGFEIVCDRPLPLQVDGEDLGDVERAELVAERGAVAVLV
ncbi:MAG TPA: diacylglycerol kinase family protein [Gaiellaceae bacterium]|jgi:diacylglycerol kinase family enzyme|nr:diacylglycerol kinase family protein [Gaiellaceae bacterium]